WEIDTSTCQPLAVRAKRHIAGLRTGVGDLVTREAEEFLSGLHIPKCNRPTAAVGQTFTVRAKRHPRADAIEGQEFFAAFRIPHVHCYLVLLILDRLENGGGEVLAVWAEGRTHQAAPHEFFLTEREGK